MVDAIIFVLALISFVGLIASWLVLPDHRWGHASVQDADGHMSSAFDRRCLEEPSRHDGAPANWPGRSS